jgi:hypothetical protein
MTAPIASGGSEITGWALHPLERAALSRRTPIAEAICAPQQFQDRDALLTSRLDAVAEVRDDAAARLEAVAGRQERVDNRTVPLHPELIGFNCLV